MHFSTALGGCRWGRSGHWPTPGSRSALLSENWAVACPLGTQPGGGCQENYLHRGLEPGCVSFGRPPEWGLSEVLSFLSTRVDIRSAVPVHQPAGAAPTPMPPGLKSDLEASDSSTEGCVPGVLGYAGSSSRPASETTHFHVSVPGSVLVFCVFSSVAQPRWGGPSRRGAGDPHPFGGPCKQRRGALCVGASRIPTWFT